MTLNPEHAPKGCRAICGTGSTLVDCPKCCFGPREKCKGPSRSRPCVQHLRRDGANVYFTKPPEEALLPCPFCGCTKVELKDYGDAVCLYSVWCPDCDQHGPTSEVESTCAALWNLRAPITVTDDMVRWAWDRIPARPTWSDVRAALEAAIGGGR